MNKVKTIKEFILKEFTLGNIKKGERLPGCREIAERLSVNKITVNKAYKAMEAEHLLYCIPRGGYYFIDSLEDTELKTEFIDFETVRPDPTLLPYKAFTHAMNRSIEEHKKRLFQYEEPLGFPELRNTLKERFAKQGVYAKDTNILITSGAQQGIYLTLKTLFSNSSSGKLLVESPTYHCTLTIARSLNITTIGIKRTIEGIDFIDLEYILKTNTITAFYLIPKFHNPTGYSLSEKDKKKIVELCVKYHVYIIEDDYLSELCTNKRTLPLHYYDTNECTFYINSFSKTFIPGIRLGAIVIPDSFMETLLEQKYILDICTSSIPQGALHYFITSGMYDKHLKKVNACLKGKLEKARALFTSVHPDVSIHIPKQGLFIWVTLPEKISIPQVKERLETYHIKIPSNASLCYSTTSDCYSTSSFGQSTLKENSLRLCISGIREEDLKALVTIIQVIRDELIKNQ